MGAPVGRTTMSAKAARLTPRPEVEHGVHQEESAPLRSATVQPARSPGSKVYRAFWLKQLHRWHWISSAVGLVSLLLFSLTGITLNHAGRIEGRSQVTTREIRLPPEKVTALASLSPGRRQPLPDTVAAWIAAEIGVSTAGREAEWSAQEAYVSLPRPGGDAWLTIDRRSGVVLYERTDRGWVSYLNDLHKGRNTGLAWAVFIDVVAAACVISTVTGLLLLQLHARHRPSTWPLVALGVAAPVLIAALLIH
jgi:uncharacterized protein